MGLFTNRKDGGLIADVIRCDEPNYLIWKWHPNGDGIGKSVRANAIRWGSSIRVKDGEVAVFLYSGAPRPAEDFIVGPCDEILKTDNLPVISEMLGLAYNGKSPLQAEVYFINLSRVLQFPFVIPYFDVFDYRYPDFSVPIAIHGKVTYSICDYRKFVKLHRMVEIDQSTIQEQVKECVTQRIKSVVANTS